MMDIYDAMVYELMDRGEIPLEELRIVDAVLASRQSFEDTLREYELEILNAREEI